MALTLTKKYIIKEWLAAILIFLFFQPFFIWSIYNSLLPIITFLFIFLCVSSSRYLIKDIKYILLLAIAFVWLSIIGDLSILGTIGIALFGAIFFTDNNYLLNSYEKFIRLFIVITSFSFVVYLLVMIGINIPHSVIKPINTLKLYNYFAYPFLVIPNAFEYYRFMGCFDEPGVMGTICAVVLLMRKFNLKQKENILVMIFGIASFSLFFYLIIIGYLLLLSKWKYKLLTVAIIMILFLIFRKGGLFYDLIFARIQFEDGKMVGNNRDMGLDSSWYEEFKKSKNYLWGLGAGSKQLYNYGGASYKDRIIEYGVVFFLYYILAFVLYAVAKLKTSLQNIVIYIIIITSILFQRPFISNLAYILLIYIPILYLSNRVENAE